MATGEGHANTALEYYSVADLLTGIDQHISNIETSLASMIALIRALALETNGLRLSPPSPEGLAAASPQERHGS